MLKFAIKRKPVELFHEAVHNKDIGRVKCLLEQNQSQFHVDEIDPDGITALQRCCFTGSLKLVQLLVAFGADLNIQDKDGWSVMHAATVASNYSIMRYLIAMGAQVALRNDQGDLAIDLARDLQSVIILAEAMRRTGKAIDVETYFERRPEVRELIEERLQQSGGIESAEYRPRASREILTSHVRSDDEFQRRSSLDVIHERHISSSNVKMMDQDLDRLMEEGIALPAQRKCTVCPKCGKRRQEPFKRRSIASLSSSSSDSSSLSDSAYSSGSTNSGVNLTNLQIAQPNNRQRSEIPLPNKPPAQKALGRCLISPTELQGILQSSRFSSPSSDDNTQANKTTCLKIASAINKVANIDELNSSGLSPLHEAAAKGDTEAVKLLLSHGAEVNRQSLNGNSPLHEAVREGNAVTASILIEYGADLFAETDSGELPVELTTDLQMKLFIESAMAIR